MNRPRSFPKRSPNSAALAILCGARLPSPYCRWLSDLLPVLLVLLLGSPAAAGTTTRVSVASDGSQGNGASSLPSLSADGRIVAFMSDATNLVPGDTNGKWDIFVHDRQSGLTTRVSVASDGSQGNKSSYPFSLSADGRVVAFASDATNLVPGDTNGVPDVFVHDRQTGLTTRVSVASDGSQGNGDSYGPSLSADGRFVAFESYATNLVPGDTNGVPDIFVHDRQTGLTTRVSVASDGSQGNWDSYRPSLSADGRVVAFESYATNLVPKDTIGVRDIFVHDRQTGLTTRVSGASDGSQGNGDSFGPSLSADGRVVAFYSPATNLVPGDTNGAYDVFVHDRQTGLTTRVSVASDGSQGNDDSLASSLSADGRVVAFFSSATNLVPGDTNGALDVFIHDRQTGLTTRVSVASDGSQGNDDSLAPSLSADGRVVAFESDATNLVPGNTNGAYDVVIYDRAPSLPSPSLFLNQARLLAGEPLTLWAAVTPGEYTFTTDVYVAVELPGGALLFLRGDGAFTAGLAPFVTGWTPSFIAAPLFSYTFTGGEPAGDYTWLAAFAQPGTLNFIGPIVSAPFTFSP